MPDKKAPLLKIILRNVLRRIENLIFLLKTLLNERHFIYLACVLVAVSCAVAVIILKMFAHNVFLLANYINAYLKLPYINSLLPIVGILLTVFVVRHFLGGHLEKGSSRILYAVAKRGGIIPKKQMYAQIITSSLTVGLGGSAGLESPITVTGAAFGSNFAMRYRLSQKDRILLLACGVSAGIGAAFNAPIAGVLFAIEVVLTDVTISAFIPIIISAATGALVSTVLMGEGVLLSFSQRLDFDYKNIPFYILLGLLAGLLSVYHARNFRRVESFMGRIKNKSYKRALFGAGILAVMIFFFPTLFGEGYESIKTLAGPNPQSLLNNTLLEGFQDKPLILLAFLSMTVLLKSFATGLTLGSGGNGGNFAPSLFVGSYLGFIVATAVNLTGLVKPLPVANFALVGMAGILAGLFHAPLTAIFLIGEITGGYALMVPLMIVSSISFAVSKQFEQHSMDVKHLADKGDAFTSDKDRNILSGIDILPLIKPSVTLNPTDNLEAMTGAISATGQQHFAVTDDRNRILGIATFLQGKSMLFNPFRQKNTKVRDIMTAPVEVPIEAGTAKIMEILDAQNLDAIAVTSEGTFTGFVYKADILEQYRQRLKEMVISIDH